MFRFYFSLLFTVCVCHALLKDTGKWIGVGLIITENRFAKTCWQLDYHTGYNNCAFMGDIKSQLHVGLPNTNLEVWGSANLPVSFKLGVHALYQYQPLLPWKRKFGYLTSVGFIMVFIFLNLKPQKSKI